MLSEATRKTLTGRRELIARSILSLNSYQPLSTRGESDRARMSGYLKELSEIESVLNGVGDSSTPEAAQAAAESIAYREAFHDWLRRGQLMSKQSHKDLIEYRATLATEGTPLQAAYPNATTGFFVPMDFQYKCISAMKSFGPWFEPGFATVVTRPTGAPYPIPADLDDNTSAAILGEGQQYGVQNLSTTFAQLGSYKFTTGFPMSNAYVQDSGIDLMEYLPKRFGVRVMRGLNPYLTTGTGSAQPAGCLNGLTAAVTATGSIRNDGAGAANTIGSDDLAALEMALDPAYRDGAKFMMHQNSVAALRKVLDKQGHPIFPGLQQGDKPTLLNYPVVTNPAMDQLQASPTSPAVTRVPIAFGAFQRFVIRMTPPIMLRLTERLADYDQTVFIMHWRADSILVNPDTSVPPVVTLQTVY